VLLMIAFTVVAGTLLVQGLTLPWLARRLRVPSPDPMDDALARATLLQQASKAGFATLAQIEADEAHEDPHGVLDLVRQRIDQRNFAAWERLGTTPGQETPSELYARVRVAMIAAERERVLEIRSSGRVDSVVVAEVLAMLDVEESLIDRVLPQHEQEEPVGLRPAPLESCAHLAATWAVETSDAGVCEDCLRDGTSWVALRQCLECGHLACCDSSPAQHATAHFRDTAHPVMQSAEPGEHWRWCFVHHVTS